MQDSEKEDDGSHSVKTTLSTHMSASSGHFEMFKNYILDNIRRQTIHESTDNNDESSFIKEPMGDDHNPRYFDESSGCLTEVVYVEDFNDEEDSENKPKLMDYHQYCLLFGTYDDIHL
ncbi:hypothetical protein RF11_10748 [Thelohanellus kitauei]|uniref:Uncharacterized protein n=1 Tax=Thelohanellus kitauei TaxID=669202 RepID=A0A0C2MTI6_THEKT|nr:hypothetical protein RF11_10748 [Thelohanellus kitauei]